MYDNIAIITQIGQEPNSILHASAAMVPDHGTKYEEYPTCHHGRMRKDGHPDGLTQTDEETDRWTRPFPSLFIETSTWLLNMDDAVD